MFRINGIDFTGSINRYGLIETPRRITGNNSGQSIGGDLIEDLLATKYDITVVVKPLRADKLKALSDQVSQEYVMLEYDSPNRNARVRVIAVPNPSSVKYAADYAARGIYDEMTISFMEK